MTTTDQPNDHVSVTHTVASEDSPETDQLSRLYTDCEREHLNPLWTQRDSLMPTAPAPSAVPFVWR
jgi:gentisate 1,2-dioxygenase